MKHNHTPAFARQTLGFPCPVPSCPEYRGPDYYTPIREPPSLSPAAFNVDAPMPVSIRARRWRCEKFQEDRTGRTWWAWSGVDAQ